MGIFNWKTQDRVTPREFRRVRTSLRSKGLSPRTVNHVSEVADGALHGKGRTSGITRSEEKQIVSTLRSPRSTHPMSEKSIEKVDKALSKKLE